ncbi:MAG TPA: MMPL family transporter [Solirubrobacteraceae bacterium]|nr:MMPL family transporter [Solirubrobacteraceae bacterium]
MNERRHLVARGYAAIVIGLRHVIPLAWIAAVVWASLTLPDLASAPTAPLEDMAAKNGPASQAQARSIERFGFPLATDTAVVQRAAGGLPPEARERQVLAARDVLARRPTVPREIRAALPLSNGLRGLPARERGTTGVTYLFFDPEMSIARRAEAAREYGEGALGGESAAVVGATGTAPAREEQFQEISEALPIIEAASVALIFVVVAAAFRSLGAPLVALFCAAVAYLLVVRILPWAGERADVTVPKEVQPVVVVLLLGLVTDYAIFFLSGMRRRVRQGEPRLPAARATVVEVAPIVFMAGLIVAAGTAALVAGKLDFFRAFGPGLALTTLISMVVAITLVPALVAIFGGRLFGRRVREEGARAAARRSSRRPAPAARGRRARAPPRGRPPRARAARTAAHRRSPRARARA